MKKPLEQSLQIDSCVAPKQGWKQSTSSHFARSNFSGSSKDPKAALNLFYVARVILVFYVCVTLKLYCLFGASTEYFSPIPVGAALHFLVLASIFVLRLSLYSFKFFLYSWYFRFCGLLTA